MRLHARLLAALLLIGASAWFVLAARERATDSARQEYHFHHDHILGTSLDLWMMSPDEATADKAESAILAEIERLRKVFSLYDPESELSRLNRAAGTTRVSADLLAVLKLYETWQARSEGAFSGQVGELVRVWKDAERTQREPDADTLDRIARQLRQPGWRIDMASQSVTRLTDQPLNLNAIAKGYIIEKASAAALKAAPALDGLLVNLGGDMFVWGHDSAGRGGWTIGVQDPHHPEDNAAPLAPLRLHNRAVATSGGYERYYTIQGKRHSHLFDPRTGRSTDGPASATVIAADNVTANALATTLCVLTPAEGLRLIAATPGAECLLIGKNGAKFRSAGFQALEIPTVPVPTEKDESGEQRLVGVNAQEKQEGAKADAWPVGFQVSFSLMLPTVKAKKYRRPYVAVWVENAEAKPVRTITVWGNNPRWIKDLPQWWKFAKNDRALVTAVSRATRSPGKYSLVWDGKDDAGKPLAQGTYTIWVEVHREHGKLVRQSGKLTCGPDPVQLKLPANPETGATVIDYAKKS